MSVTARGGYQIVDGANARLVLGTVNSVKIPGIYNKAFNQVNKPCYFGGLTVDDAGTIYTIPYQIIVFRVTSSGLSFSVTPDTGSNPFSLFIDNTDTLSID